MQRSFGPIQLEKVLQPIAVLGFILSPPIICVYLRAGWTIGRASERYTKYKNACDELVGCTLAGIQPSSCEFVISSVFLLIKLITTMLH